MQKNSQGNTREKPLSYPNAKGVDDIKDQNVCQFSTHQLQVTTQFKLPVNNQDMPVATNILLVLAILWIAAATDLDLPPGYGERLPLTTIAESLP